MKSRDISLVVAGALMGLFAVFLVNPGQLSFESPSAECQVECHQADG
ncbi:MAG: hypothetical protein AAFO84_06290 [Cyanobacteria bacterium J06598_1]